MTHYLLDTNHLSPLVTVDYPLRQRILDALDAGHSFSTTVLSATEALFGIYLTPRIKTNLLIWESVKNGLSFIEVTMSVAELAAGLQASLRRQGWQLQTVDAIITAIAVCNNLTLLTTDGDFERVPNLLFEN